MTDLKPEDLAKWANDWPNWKCTDEVVAGVLSLLADRARMERAIRGYQAEAREVEQAAGKALGYPWFKDDQTNFPGATEADGVCVGEHVAGTITSELADKCARMEKALRAAAVYLDALGDNLLRNDADMQLDECRDPKDVAEGIRQALGASPDGK